MNFLIAALSYRSIDDVLYFTATGIITSGGTSKIKNMLAYFVLLSVCANFAPKAKTDRAVKMKNENYKPPNNK
jgi:hypothetical protein